MMRLSEAARAMHGHLTGSDLDFAGVSTDTRTLQAGELYIALRGEHFDGAQFVAAAVAAGAVAAVVNEDSDISECGCPVVRVKDTRIALGKLAKHWRGKFTCPVIAVTGSNGKTTVKEMLAAICSQAAGGMDKVLATRGNLNNDIGMPLTLLQLRKTHQYAVIEMGMNHLGEIDYLTHLAQPDVALVNNAAGAHLQGLGTIERVAQAKGEIFAGLKRDGTAVINADDAHAPLWRELAKLRRVMEFGLSTEAPVRGRWQVQDGGGRLEVETPAGAQTIPLQVPGEHNARNALAAIAAGLAVHIPMAAIAAGLESFGGVSGRLQRKRGKAGSTVIDDTYNANPASMRAAVEVLVQAPGKRIFVMGDMGELGEGAATLHAEIGRYAKAQGVEQLLALGEHSAAAVQAFGAGGKHYSAMSLLQQDLEKELQEGTTVMVKGSRFMKMEQVVANCVEQEATCCSH